MYLVFSIVLKSIEKPFVAIIAERVVRCTTRQGAPAVHAPPLQSAGTHARTYTQARRREGYTARFLLRLKLNYVDETRRDEKGQDRERDGERKRRG